MLVLQDSVLSVIPVSFVSPFPTDICSMRKERDGIAPPVYLLSISSSPLKLSGNPSSVSSRSSLSGGAPFLVTRGSVIQGITEGVKGNVLTVTVCKCKNTGQYIKQMLKNNTNLLVEGFLAFLVLPILPIYFVYLCFIIRCKISSSKFNQIQQFSKLF